MVEKLNPDDYTGPELLDKVNELVKEVNYLRQQLLRVQDDPQRKIADEVEAKELDKLAQPEE